MFNKELGYDPASPESIESYALQLEDKIFMEIIAEKGHTNEDTIEAYANKLRKGGLGNLLEEVFFGYKANSNQEGTNSAPTTAKSLKMRQINSCINHFEIELNLTLLEAGTK